VNIVTPGGNGTPEARNIGKPARPAAPSADRRAGDTRSSDASSSLQLSARGEKFASLRARLDGLDASRAERVERLRALIASGRYHVDGATIAAGMLADPATAEALGMR
jgi:flagellar biosynthesis anti-sigma factor FlgM